MAQLFVQHPFELRIRKRKGKIRMQEKQDVEIITRQDENEASLGEINTSGIISSGGPLLGCTCSCVSYVAPPMKLHIPPLVAH